MIIECSDLNYVTLKEDFVLLDFYSPTCGPCKMTAKYLEEFSKKHPEITIYKVDIEQYPNFIDPYQIQSVPTIVCCNWEKELWRNSGLMTVQMLEEKFKYA